MSNINYKFKYAYEELKSQFSQIDAAGDVIDGKAKDLLASSSIVLTLFGGLQTAIFDHEKTGLYYQGLGFILLLFVILLVILVYCLHPRTYQTVFDPTEEGLQETILDQKDEAELLEQLVSNYIDKIRINADINKKKVDTLVVGYWLFVLLIVSAIAFQFFIV